jgi:hypothetical protein
MIKTEIKVEDSNQCKTPEKVKEEEISYGTIDVSSMTTPICALNESINTSIK